MKVRIAGLALAALGLAPVPSLQAQVPPDEFRREIQSLREMLLEIRKDLDEIRAELPRRAPRNPVGALLDVSRRPFRGEATAPLALVEFSDYQCPFCARHVRETAPAIVDQYVRTGKLKVVFVDLPLERAHPLAFKAAEAGQCAGEQQKFWEMHDRLFASEGRLEPWTAHAAALELDVPLFEDCLDSGRYAVEIRRGMAEAARFGIVATPYFLLGRTERNGSRLRVAAAIEGAKPFAAFKEAIDRLVSEGTTPAPPER